MIKVGVSGTAGRVGATIASLVDKDQDMELMLALEKKGNEFVGSHGNLT